MDSLLSMPIKDVMFIVPIILFLHELEEWNIYEYHQKSYTDTVIVETRLGTRLWLLFLGTVGFLWTLACFWIQNEMISTMIFILLVDFCLLNAIQHVGLTIKTRKYNPGFIIGGIVGLPANILVIIIISRTGVMPGYVLIGMLCLILPGIIDAGVNSRKGKLPKMVVGILRFSNVLEGMMSK
jgi:hypothetical protein